ncbi:A1S_1983 family putative colistin resistance protein [Acinetobacter rudis]|uniref:Uncharacterized protein n=1 Tax=Acinetobacter rudis CIP 110305 TaxID=421052 RepID=S3P3H0_9GAMM|nr:hypothetical protein [Acinetobacter rudis]EPF73366.1 hypothetical protein F945_02122 [Acinetobacter rudis CIP 110305]
MLIKTDYLSMKSILTLLSLSSIAIFSSQISHAQAIPCDSTHNIAWKKMLCGTQFKQQRLSLNDKYLTAYQVTDAPTQLLEVTQQLWLKRIQQCKSKRCFEEQIDQRSEELNFYSSMNQSMTQHFIKYNQGKIAIPEVHIMVHQLSEDRIKIEGSAYLNPNNKSQQQQSSLFAYSSPNPKNPILDNDRRCSYQMTFHKALLVIQSKQTECQRFTGHYRRYD